jgi:Flp pilus assembly protein TadD
MGNRTTALATWALCLAAASGASGLAAQAPAPLEQEELGEVITVPVDDEDSGALSELVEIDTGDLETAAEERYLAGDLEGAGVLFRRLAYATEEPRRRMGFLLSAAWLDHQLARSWEARELLIAGLREDPDYPFRPENYPQGFVDLYLDAERQVAGERRSRTVTLVRGAAESLGAGDLEGARRLLMEALTLAPQEPLAIYNLGVVELRQERPQEALAAFERLLAMETGQPGTVPHDLLALTRASLGLLYYQRDHPEDARDHLREAVRLDPLNARSWETLGLALRRLGEGRDAREAFRRALALSPEDPQIANNLAALWIAEEDFAEAVRLLRATADRHPADQQTRLNLALAERGTGDLDAAVATLRRALELDAGNRSGNAARAASYLALVQYQRGRPEDAAAAARTALGWRPQDVEAHLVLGLARQALRDLGGARESFEEARRLDPSRPETYNNIGAVLVALGELEEAEQAFRRALTIRPGFPEAEANLAMVAARRAEQAAEAAAESGDRRRRTPRPP